MRSSRFPGCAGKPPAVPGSTPIRAGPLSRPARPADPPAQLSLAGLSSPRRRQLVSLPYLQRLTVPTLWRGSVQVIPGAGHALHQEAPGAFAALLGHFVADLP